MQNKTKFCGNPKPFLRTTKQSKDLEAQVQRSHQRAASFEREAANEIAWDLGFVGFLRRLGLISVVRVCFGVELG